MNKKVRAFTLMEVTIAMLISALVVSVTYTAYKIVGNTYQNYRKKQEQIGDLSLADQLLRRDFFKARKIYRTAQGLLFEQPEGKITYQLLKEQVIRQQFEIRVDTFKISITDLQCAFEQKEAETGALTDQCRFIMELGKNRIPRNYQKIYSKQDLFE